MISIRPSGSHAPVDDDAPWPVVVAAGLTLALWGAVSLAMRHPVAGPDPVPAAPTPSEVLVFLAPRHPASVRSPGSARSARLAVDVHTLPAPDTGSSIARENGSLPHEPPTPAPTIEATVPTLPLQPDAASSRLAVGRRPGVPWYSAPRPRNPFASREPLSTTERDSMAGAIGPAVPELAARRVQPQSERDAAAREAMLKMRLTGRILLVPPDNTGGLITSSIPLSLFSRGPTKAKRKRDDRAFDENRARLERLRQRADSARRLRGDTLRR